MSMQPQCSNLTKLQDTILPAGIGRLCINSPSHDLNILAPHLLFLSMEKTIAQHNRSTARYVTPTLTTTDSNLTPTPPCVSR
jgi:hypothetical protein